MTMRLIDADELIHEGSKKTNAEVIRSMNDYDLAHWLSTTFCYGYGETDFFVWLTKNCEKDARYPAF